MTPAPLFLGIDTSNYTTSVALVRGGEVLSMRKLPVAVPAGERGARQRDALFAHTGNLPRLLEDLREDAVAATLDCSASTPIETDAAALPRDGIRNSRASLGALPLAAIGYSARPRDAEGSYMPCFLAGEGAARAMAAALGVPAMPFSHQAGHIAAAIYSSGSSRALGSRFAAFHLSGGTTDILLVTGGGSAPAEKSGKLDLAQFSATSLAADPRASNSPPGGAPPAPSPPLFRVTRIGGTEDLTAGQAIDRVGVRLGFAFPAGEMMERAASSVSLPRTHPAVDGLACHFSGVENQADRLLCEGQSAAEVAAYVLAYVRDTLRALARNLRAREPGIPLLFAGGVAGCRLIRAPLEEEFGAVFAQPAYSSDNAAGVALLAEELYRRESERSR